MRMLTNANGDSVTIKPGKKSVSVRTRNSDGTDDWTRYDTDDPDGRAADVAEAFAAEGYRES